MRQISGYLYQGRLELLHRGLGHDVPAERCDEEPGATHAADMGNANAAIAHDLCHIFCACHALSMSRSRPTQLASLRRWNRLPHTRFWDVSPLHNTATSVHNTVTCTTPKCDTARHDTVWSMCGGISMKRRLQRRPAHTYHAVLHIRWCMYVVQCGRAFCASVECNPSSRR